MLLDSSGLAGGLCQIAKDLNGDGSVEMGIRMSVASLPSDAKGIVFQIDEYQPDGTTFIDTDYQYPHKLVARRPVVAGHVYKISAAGVAFNGTVGAFSSATMFTPTGKTTVSDPSGLSALSGRLQYTVIWNASPDPDYLLTEIFHTFSSGIVPGPTTFPNATGVSGFAGSSGVLQVNVDAVVAHYVFARHVNRSGKKSNWVRITSTTVTPYGIGNGDVEDHSIDYNQWTFTALNDGNAALAFGDVGTYAFLKNNTGSTIAGAGTAAGAALQYSDTGLTGTNSPAGTWRCLGRAVNGQATMFLRIL